MQRCWIQLRSGCRKNKHPRFENNKFPEACMFLLINESCWFRLWSKTISWYDSVNVIPNDILLEFMANFFFYFVFFAFVCCFCFFLFLCFAFFCFLFVYLFVFLCQSNCIANPCKNNATCQSGFTDKGYRCLCSAGFKGQTCDEGNAVL